MAAAGATTTDAQSDGANSARTTIGSSFTCMFTQDAGYACYHKEGVEGQDLKAWSTPVPDAESALMDRYPYEKKKD